MVWRAGDVADLYGVDNSTVHRWERSGRLRPSRRDPGGFKYWLAHEVLEDLAKPVASVPRPVVHRSVDELVSATRRPRRRAS
jgi:predicted site-specific integrase-resolvase